MEDKEVGELWHDASTKGGYWDNVGAADAICELIRNLVEERARHYSRDCKCLGIGHTPLHIAEACRDFGIDPETWK